MTLAEFIKQRKYLIWHTDNYDNLGPESIAEAVLNYGDFNDINELKKIIGIKKMAAIFKKAAKKKRTNLRPEIINYFTLYFKKYAK
jgi:UDP-glucose 4-epimerase